MEYNVLKQSIAAVVKANGNEEITGDLLQQVLIAMVDVLGTGYQFAGLAVPTTNPGTPDAKMFYIATQAGTYSNFGSPAPVLTGEQVAILRFSTSWTAVVLDIPTKAYVDNALTGKVDKVEGKGLSANDLTNELVSLINGAFQKANIVDELGTDATKVLSQAAITTVLLQYAKVDGYYSSLIAGAAANLVGRGSVPASFLRRTTGGTADVGTGTAKYTKIEGNSIIWNQLVKLNSFSSKTGNNCTFTNNGDGTYTIVVGEGGMSGNLLVDTESVLSTIGHKVALIVTGDVNDAMTFRINDNQNVANNTIQTLSSAVISVRIASTLPVGTYTVRFMIFDLTLMGMASRINTVAEFTALYPLLFYKNNAGEVLPFAAQKLVTTGFNQWDEDWEVGSLSSVTGEEVSSSNHIRSKNFCPCFGNTEYYAKTPSSTIYILVLFYDANENYISYVVGKNNIITTPQNAAYFKIRSNNSGEIVTYNHDICINLSWSGYRNGEYEPYELHELTVDPANWEDANGNKIFPYGGMHGVNTKKDFATPDNDGYIHKATRVCGRVDLGALTYTRSNYGTSENPVYVFVADIGKAAGGNIICPKYPVSTYAAAANLPDKSILSSTNAGLYIRDDSYSTVDAFKAAMSGVYLVYELATPVEIELAEPVAASYYANDFGTEEWQPANDDEPYTAPCEMQIAYAMNAVDTLRRLPENYISVGSFENFCTELATQLGAALNKTITITPTYNSENAEYDYSITISDI